MRIIERNQRMQNYRWNSSLHGSLQSVQNDFFFEVRWLMRQNSSDTVDLRMKRIIHINTHTRWFPSKMRTLSFPNLLRS